MTAFDLVRDPIRSNVWWLICADCKIAKLSVREIDDEQIEIDCWSPDAEYSSWLGGLRFEPRESRGEIPQRQYVVPEHDFRFGYDEEE